MGNRREVGRGGAPAIRVLVFRKRRRLSQRPTAPRPREGGVSRKPPAASLPRDSTRHGTGHGIGHGTAGRLSRRGRTKPTQGGGTRSRPPEVAQTAQALRPRAPRNAPQSQSVQLRLDTDAGGVGWGAEGPQKLRNKPRAAKGPGEVPLEFRGWRRVTGALCRPSCSRNTGVAGVGARGQLGKPGGLGGGHWPGMG